MRVFLGIPIPDEIRKKISPVMEKIRMKGVKTVKPENLHWTVRFFGELGERDVEKVISTMDSIEGMGMEIEVRGIGTFPSSFVRVIWIGVGRGGEEFKEFLNMVNKKFSGLGKDAEVVPHLTIGRVRFLKDREKLAAVLNEIRDTEIGEMRVDRLVLYKSELKKGGPVYMEIKGVKI